MFAAINLLVFVFLTGYAFLLLISKPSYVKLSKTERVLLTGREKFLLLTLVTGMVMVGSFSSLRLMIWLSFMMFAFVIYRKSPHFNSLTIIYIIFLIWLGITMVWSPDLLYGIRVYLKYLYPFIVLLFAATFVHSKDFIFVAMRWMLAAAFITSVFLGGFMTHIIGFWYFYIGNLFWPISTLADYLAVMAAVSFVMWWRTGEKKYLFLIGWFIISSLLQGVRTGILSIGVMLMVASYLRYKIASFPYLIGAVAIGITMILFVPQLKEKMFFDPEKVQTIDDITGAFEENNLNTNLRTYMWEDLMHRFHDEHEWLGSGLGSVQHYMYENFVFGGLHVPHSDYVQMMCDSGNVGLILYLFFPLMMYFYTIRYVHKKPASALNASAILAFLAYAAVLPAMAFDNIVNYSFASHSYPFIFAGIFLAYRRIEKRQQRIQGV
ncbi:O-antigen ligase family protein [Sulfurovum sp. zt1-1]|uniref:O-antigen ligase family protein n=1 Tax=Sulfurovum zhangzhouensis TaxID=3019067 RepID=A0ABT7R0E3_9BACT|nr:O-antigen ligase family protein [Sulfurovum zhangzhouensis]MDM5272547.1 O-antigen ligase family protein [Sulfurovum zhangzhouensis]